VSEPRVLVVDDEAPIRRALEANLRARGYEVELAATGEQALDAAARHHPDAIILDLGLPGMDGVDVIRGLRGWSAVPIIVLSARGAEPDKVAALRRQLPSAEAPVVVTDDFRVDLAAKQVTSATGEPIRLTPIEWGLLEVLVRNAGRLVAPKQLLQEVWGPAYGEESNYLRVHLAHLRRKLEPDPPRPRYFVTEPGMGYRFVPSEG
jgi:two-component system, OmpR family, KDP operon response regulator KdpE